MVVECKGLILADNIRIADSFTTRFKGLMGKKSLGDGEGLLLMNCPSIHCFFMKMPIDAVYLSKNMTVLGIETLPPWRIGHHIKNTAHVLELAAGTSLMTVGSTLQFSNSSSAPINMGGMSDAGVKQ